MNSQRIETANGRRTAWLLPCLLSLLSGAAGAQTAAPAVQQIPGMVASLAHKTVIPKTDPYCNSGRYSSPCTAVTVPRTFWHYDRKRGHRGIIDWVLVELRQTAGGPHTATEDTIVARKAALLLSNGRVVDARRYTTLSPQPGPDDCPAEITANTAGCPAVWFDNVEMTDSMYIVVRHRNHLDVISARPVTRQGDVYSWDFSVGIGQAFGGELGHGLHTGGVAVLYSGDGNGNNVIEMRDSRYTLFNNFVAIYSDRDCNMNGFIARSECGDYVYNPYRDAENTGRVSQVP